MSIKIEIIAASAAEMQQELLTLLHGNKPELVVPSRDLVLHTKDKPEPEAPAEKAEAAPVDAKPKKRRSSKAKTEAAEKAVEETPETEAAPETHEETEAAPETHAEPKSKKVSLSDIRQLIVSKGTAAKPKIKNLLERTYGVELLPEVPEDKLAALYADIEAL